jgi:pectinesterase
VGVIRIAPGIYKEKVIVSKANVTLIGLGKDPKEVVITFGDSAKNAGSTFKSGTIIVDADGFKAENLSILNTWWDEHSDPTDVASRGATAQLGSRRS